VTAWVAWPVGSNDVWHRWQTDRGVTRGTGIQIVLYASFGFVANQSDEQIERNAGPTLVHPSNRKTPSTFTGRCLTWFQSGRSTCHGQSGICTWLSPRGGLRFSLGLSLGRGRLHRNPRPTGERQGALVIPYCRPTHTSPSCLASLRQSWQLLPNDAKPKGYEADDRLPWESDPTPGNASQIRDDFGRDRPRPSMSNGPSRTWPHRGRKYFSPSGKDFLLLVSPDFVHATVPQAEFGGEVNCGLKIEQADTLLMSWSFRKAGTVVDTRIRMGIRGLFVAAGVAILAWPGRDCSDHRVGGSAMTGWTPNTNTPGLPTSLGQWHSG